jgi:hypothetical protein
MPFVNWLTKLNGPLNKEFVTTNFFYSEGKLYYRKTNRLAGQNSATNGYYSTRIWGKHVCTHVLIWIYHFDQIPDGHQVDHIDRNPLNNMIENLRLATPTQNRLNRTATRTNKLGVKGVCWHRQNKKYVARIGINGSKIFLGYFDDLNEAALAYENASAKYHGAFNPSAHRLITAAEAQPGTEM